MYEGTPHPEDQDRWWKLIENYKVTILYTAPTTIRTLMKWGHELLEPYDLSSLRVLGSVGEPINPEAWVWYRTYVGGGRTPVVDTWWQTETGAIMISPLPGVTATKPGAAMGPRPGHRLVRDPARQRRRGRDPRREVRAGASRARRSRDRADRETSSDPGRPRTAQDPQRQDHATAVA